MEFFSNFIFHMDEWLNQMVLLHPIAVYALFFGIVFCESAFFPMAPFMPGDGLLFGVGVFAASGLVHLGMAILFLIAGGVLGNILGYQLGKKFGPWLFDRFAWLNRKHYEEAHRFYQTQGSKAFMFSRYLPVVRALVPFVAGVAGMSKVAFMKNNILSVSLWVVSITLAAFYLGHLPFIKNHFAGIIFGSAGLSLFAIVLLFINRLITKPAN